MRVQAKCALEPAACIRIVSETAFDHPAVEELECVEGSEPESPAGVGESFGAPSVTGERPAQDVVSVDAWARALRLPREGKRAPKFYAVVDVEERSLEIGANAVCDQQPFDDADERVLL